MRGSERLDSVGVQLMPNGLLTGYKRKRKKRRRESRAERTKCRRTDSELLSLLVRSLSSAPSRTCAGFEEARAVRGTPRVRPAAPPTCFPFLCDATRRDRHLFAALFVLVSIDSVPPVGCNIFLCYFLVFISTYSLVVSICVVSDPRVLCLLGRVPVQPSVLCRNRSSVVIGSLSAHQPNLPS